jgi:hypothetical protein
MRIFNHWAVVSVPALVFGAIDVPELLGVVVGTTTVVVEIGSGVVVVDAAETGGELSCAGATFV